MWKLFSRKKNSWALVTLRASSEFPMMYYNASSGESWFIPNCISPSRLSHSWITSNFAHTRTLSRFIMKGFAFRIDVKCNVKLVFITIWCHCSESMTELYRSITPRLWSGFSMNLNGLSRGQGSETPTWSHLNIPGISVLAISWSPVDNAGIYVRAVGELSESRQHVASVAQSGEMMVWILLHSPWRQWLHTAHERGQGSIKPCGFRVWSSGKGDKLPFQVQRSSVFTIATNGMTRKNLIFFNQLSLYIHEFTEK
jgi:hypothetical protein